MHKNSGSIVEQMNTTNERTLFGMTKDQLVKYGMSLLSTKAFAEENPEEEEQPKAPTINYEDLIAKARKEEKDKQYKKINKLETQITTLTEQHNNDLIRIGTLEKELEDTKAKLTNVNGDESKELKELKERVATLEKEKKALEEEVANFEAVDEEKIREEVKAELEGEYEVKTYRMEQLASLKDEILVPELVFGQTKEEIDNAIEVAKQRSAQIRESLGATQGNNRRTPKTPSNPSSNGFTDKGVDLNYLASLDPASKEYREVRHQLGLDR